MTSLAPSAGTLTVRANAMELMFDTLFHHSPELNPLKTLSNYCVQYRVNLSDRNVLTDNESKTNQLFVSVASQKCHSQRGPDHGLWFRVECYEQLGSLDLNFEDHSLFSDGCKRNSVTNVLQPFLHVKVVLCILLQVIESSSAVAVAVLLSDEFQQIPNVKRVGVILTGGWVTVNLWISWRVESWHAIWCIELVHEGWVVVVRVQSKSEQNQSKQSKTKQQQQAKQPKASKPKQTKTSRAIKRKQANQSQ